MSVEEVVQALSWVHSMVDPTEHKLVQQVLTRAKHYFDNGFYEKGVNDSDQLFFSYKSILTVRCRRHSGGLP